MTLTEREQLIFIYAVFIASLKEGELNVDEFLECISNTAEKIGLDPNKFANVSDEIEEFDNRLQNIIVGGV